MTRHRPIRLTEAEAVQLGLGSLAETPSQRRRYPSAPPVPDEHSEQAALIRRAFDRAALDPAAADLGLLFAIPNGGDRHPAVAAKLQAEGVQPGVPDLFLPVARHGYHGLFLEMKRTKGGVVSVYQADWHAELRAQGYQVDVCTGMGVAWEILCTYLDLARHWRGPGVD